MPSPIAFELFGYEVRWYGLFIASAMMIGIILATKRGGKKHISQDDILDILIIAIPCAIIGARLYYVIFNLSYYFDNPSEIIAIWRGGLAIHGGILGGALGGYLVCKKKKIDFLMMLDIFAPCFPLGQAIGRWGNYFNQEAYGTETTLPWAITVNDPLKGLIHVHPTFLYESIWDLFIFMFILYYDKKHKKADGELICIYAVLYSIGRFFIEGLRIDSLYFLGLRTAQLVSLSLIIIGSVMFVKIRKKNA
ncbi:MAG: prolipoprotein diacylglyceryl transferase [Eubacteriales bacterium]